ncbi:hypothetical protein BD770DRAFT_401011 [Pilaira anomala]|nr:hypothetical protein BD770DRAFT_401011 [Pilaira anomala]
METISEETFLIIISHLSFWDKTRCIRVSKRWRNLIRRSMLYALSIRDHFSLHGAIDENTGKQVRHLRLENCPFDTFTTLSLPGIFLNLKTLNWTSDVPSPKLTIPRKPIYSQQFEKWNQLESIVSLTKEYNPVPILVLESSKFTRLTTLIIEPSNSEKPFDIPYSKELLECLKNTPALTNLTLDNITASPFYMDELHRNLPKLGSLKLTGFCFANSGAYKPVSQPVVRLKYLVIKFKSSPHYTLCREFQSEQIMSYLLYVDTKYSHLKTLSIGFDDDATPMPFIRSVEGYVIKILSHLPYLKDYQLRVSTMTDMILLTMDENKIEISNIKIYLEEYDVRRQFNFILDSEQKDYITNLEITDTVQSSRAVPNDILVFDFVRNLKCLRTLELGCQTKALSYSYELLINIVDELKTLKFLAISVFDNILNPEIALDTYQIIETSLNFVDLNFIGDASNKSRLKYLNNILQFVLLSSPHLRTFSLDGALYFEEFGTISLDVTQNKVLTELTVSLDNVSYYTFERSDQHCIRYRNIDEPMNLTETEEFKPTYSLELLSNPDILDLDDAEPKTKDKIACQ